MEGKENHPSLENLIEELDLGIETLHPGGLETTKRLAEMCGIEEGMKVLDVASGTGSSAVFLAENYDCSVTGIDYSKMMVEKAKERTRGMKIDVEFLTGDAHQLPFREGSFDVVISESTLCFLEKERALDEMVRVVKTGGRIGIHDICWSEDADESLKRRLDELEGERPETRDGWVNLFEKAGLLEIEAEERPDVIDGWMEEMESDLGILGKLEIFIKILMKWGFGGFLRIRESQKIFEDSRTGYIFIVGRKPSKL